MGATNVIEINERRLAVTLTGTSTLVLTFDVGGSHVSAGLCRLSDLKVIRVASAPLGEIASFEEFVDLLDSLGTEAAGAEKNIAGASLAVPGPFDCQAGVSLMKHKLKPLYGKNLRGALAAKFELKTDKIRFLNDACAYLLGEVGAGSVKGAKRAAGLTLGTGVGSAFAIDGRAVTEGDGVPPGGEIWDFPYADGTVEDLISTRKLKADYLALTGKDIEVIEIAAAAATEPAARQVFETFGLHLGQVLRDVVAPFRPDMVVIGGGISRSATLFLPVTEGQIAGLGFRVVKSTLLDLAALVGAAQFWREEFAQSGAEALETR
jgi:glucokinase